MNVFLNKTVKFIVRLKKSIHFHKATIARFTLFHHFSYRNMTTESNFSQVNVLRPPPNVRGMTVLDREKFQTEVKVPYLIIPVDKVKTSLKILKPYLLKIPKFNPVQEENNKRKILLHPHQFEEKLVYLQKIFIDLCLGDVTWTKILLTYDNWSSEDVFKAVLPENTVGNVSSFSIIGHIIHLNLKPDLLEYKMLIGQVLLDKYSNIKTIVNKSEIIENTFRNFKLELLAGEHNYQVLVKENKFQYAFDFEKVFWNPRLGKEHDEIVKKASPGDIVYDVFAGVGPFAVPLAKKKCHVYANDLNPDSYHWLCHNAKLNKVEQFLQSYNVDGNAFIQTIIKSGLVKHFNSEEEKVGSVHIVMNLPAAALTFLKSFHGLLVGECVKYFKMPIVHCYFFKRKDEEAIDVIGSYLDEDSKKNIELTSVRLVAPNKLMMRVTYKIPRDVLCCDDYLTSVPCAKRIKLAEENNDAALETVKKDYIAD